MPENLVILRPEMNDAVLDQIVLSASSAHGLVEQLVRISDDLKARLLSGNRTTARSAAQELMRVYFEPATPGP